MPPGGSWALEESRPKPAFRAPLLQCPGRPAWRERVRRSGSGIARPPPGTRARSSRRLRWRRAPAPGRLSGRLATR